MKQTIINLIQSAVERTVVVSKQAVTYIVGASVAATAFADQVAEAAPVFGESATSAVVTVAAAIAGAVAVIRRVAPVPKEVRGVLFDVDKLYEVLGVDPEEVELGIGLDPVEWFDEDDAEA